MDCVMKQIFDQKALSSCSNVASGLAYEWPFELALICAYLAPKLMIESVPRPSRPMPTSFPT